MILRFILKLWPALLPILLYLLWVMVIERLILQCLLKKKNKEKIIDGEYKVVGEKTTSAEKSDNNKFSLQDRNFVAVLYVSLIALIVTLIVTALSSPNKNSSGYVPAEYKDGKIIPPQRSK